MEKVKVQQNTASIRLVVKPAFKKKVKKQAEILGVNMSTYIKHLILADIQDLPVKKASARVRRNLTKALSDVGIETGDRNAAKVLDELV